MRILIATEGTRGDVQPFVALACGLRAAGHHPVLAACLPDWSFISGHDIEFVPLDAAGTLRRAVNDTLPHTTSGGLRGLRSQFRLIDTAARHLRPMLDELWAAAAGADLVVHMPGVVGGQHLGEGLRVPTVVGTPAPIYVPTRDEAHPWWPRRVPLPRALNRATYRLPRAFLRPYDRVFDGWREQGLRLGRRCGRHDPLRAPCGDHAPVLNAFSRYVVRPPSDTPAAVHTTGYWLLPAPPGWAPPPGLVDFLDSGSPPVYVGFGSMPGQDPARRWRTILAAIRRLGVRAVVATGWGGLRVDDVPRGIHVLAEAPHAWLFPRMAAIVHHGGAGTTGAALAAGRPQVICPYFRDQPFWARRAYRLGVAPRAVPQRALDEDSLTAALMAVLGDQGMAERAAHLGELVRSENGVATAVDALERIAGVRYTQGRDADERPPRVTAGRAVPMPLPDK